MKRKGEGVVRTGVCLGIVMISTQDWQKRRMGHIDFGGPIENHSILYGAVTQLSCMCLPAFVCVCVGASYNCANQTMGRMCLPLSQRQEAGNTFLWLLLLTNKLKSCDSKNVCTKWVLLLPRSLSASSAQLELGLWLGLWLGALLSSTRLPLAKFKLLLLRFCSWLHFILVAAAAASLAAAAVAVDDDFPFCAQVFFVVCTNSFLSPLP